MKKRSFFDRAYERQSASEICDGQNVQCSRHWTEPTICHQKFGSKCDPGVLGQAGGFFFCQTGYTHVRSHRIFFDKLLRLRTQRTHDTRKLVQITNSLVFCRTSFCGNGSGCRATKFVSDGMRKVMPQFLPQRINRISTKKIQVCREKTCNNHYEKFSESVGPRAVMCRPVPKFLFFWFVPKVIATFFSDKEAGNSARMGM